MTSAATAHQPERGAGKPQTGVAHSDHHYSTFGGLLFG